MNLERTSILALESRRGEGEFPMPENRVPTNFDDAMDWIGARSGSYTMKLDNSRVVISVTLGDHSASEVAASTDEADLEGALLRAIGRIVRGES